MDWDRQKAEKYTWCVIDEFGRLYVAYSEIDAYMVKGDVGGTVYLRGCEYSGLKMSWDREEAEKLRKEGLTQEQIGFVLGRIAEHRQQADREGWKRGYSLAEILLQNPKE